MAKLTAHGLRLTVVDANSAESRKPTAESHREFSSTQVNSASKWGRRAADLYSADYVRRYRAADDDVVNGALIASFGGWLTALCEQFGRDIAILDLGCGTGRYFHALRRVRELVGIDISVPMIAEARQRVAAGKIGTANVTLVEGDFLVHPFEHRRFDLVYSIGALGEHSPIDRHVAACIHDWLVPGGRFAFTAVHWQSFSVPRTLERRAGEWLLPVTAGSLRTRLRERLLAGGLYADETYLRDLLESTGFEVESIERHTSHVHVHLMCVARRV